MLGTPNTLKPKYAKRLEERRAKVETDGLKSRRDRRSNESLLWARR